MRCTRRAASRRTKILAAGFAPGEKSTAKALLPVQLRGGAEEAPPFGLPGFASRFLFFFLQYLHAVLSGNKRFCCDLQEQAVLYQADYVVEVMSGFFGVVDRAKGTV
jgi:hypothetical protein